MHPSQTGHVIYRNANTCRTCRVSVLIRLKAWLWADVQTDPSREVILGRCNHGRGLQAQCVAEQVDFLDLFRGSLPSASLLLTSSPYS